MARANRWSDGTLLATDMKVLETYHMKCQCQILGIRWSDYICNVNMQACTGLTPLGEILAACRISVFGHIAPFESDVPAHMALRRHSDLSVGRPPGPVWRRRPGRPRSRWIDQIRRDSSSSRVELGRRAIRRGHATQRSPSATWHRWWWNWWSQLEALMKFTPNKNNFWANHII